MSADTYLTLCSIGELLCLVPVGINIVRRIRRKRTILSDLSADIALFQMVALSFLRDVPPT